MPSPYLGAFRGEAQRLGALMPDSQGAVRWPRDGASHSVLVDDDRLPLADGSVDRLLAVHCLEVADGTRPLLREMWRVLAPEGRMLLVVPNRRGVWARFDKTPFGHGRPYSRRQLDELLVDAMFTPLDWGGALFFPPLGRQIAAALVDGLGARRRRRSRRRSAGVLIVEASKELMAPIGRPAKARRLRQLVPSATPTRRDSRLAGFAEALRGLQVDRHELRDALLGHGDAEQAAHARHRHRVMRDDEEARRRVRRHALQQAAEAVDVGVIERRIDLIEHADRRRVGQEHREDQRHCGQRLLAARKQRQRRRLLARRLGDDLQAAFERILALDHFQARLAAAEQRREQLAEVRVDRLEGVLQPLVRLAIELADGAAQLGDGVLDVGLLGVEAGGLDAELPAAPRRRRD